MIPADKDNPLRAQLKNDTDQPGDLSAIEFDIFTTANTSTGVEIYLDFEAQRDLHPSAKNNLGQRVPYSIAKRGVYYSARMLSTQLRAGNQDYQHLKRCYSIWLLFNPLKYRPQVLSFRMLPDLNTSEYTDELLQKYSRDIDLLRVIFIAIDADGLSNEPLQQFLSSVFFKKSENLKTYIPNVSEFDSIYREVSSMCNMRDVYRDIYSQRGIEEGMKKGMKEGMEKGRLEVLTKLAHVRITQGLSKSEMLSELITTFDATEDQACYAYQAAISK